MKNFKFLPSEAEIKEFQNEWFLKDHIAVILPMNRRFPTPRENSSSYREIPTTPLTRVVKTFKKSIYSVPTLKIKILNPCINTLSFIGYHIDNKSIIVDKANGRVICFAEGNFQMIEIEENHTMIAIVSNNKCKVIEKINADNYTIDEVEVFGQMKEKNIKQDGELRSLFNIKEHTYSWEVCFYQKFIRKNLDEIEKWEIDE